MLTVIGAMGLAWAYARAEAQVLVPLEYSGFLWASLFGWLFFAEELTLPTAAATAIIIAACWLATRGRAPTTWRSSRSDAIAARTRGHANPLRSGKDVDEALPSPCCAAAHLIFWRICCGIPAQVRGNRRPPRPFDG